MRNELGQSTRESLIAYHAKGGWNEFLEKLYRRSAEAAQAGFVPGRLVSREVGELETQLNEVFSISGLACDVSYVMRNAVGLFPFHTRMKIWRDFFGSQWSLLPTCLLPDWQKVGLKLAWQRIKGEGRRKSCAASSARPTGNARIPS